MRNYLFTYDLNSPGQNYVELWAELKRLGGFRILDSAWVIPKSQSTAVQLRDHLKRYTDANDGIFVTRIPREDWGSSNTKVGGYIMEGALNT